MAFPAPNADPCYCVIGAGASGLVAAKNLREKGLAAEILEAESDLGGLWNYDLPCGRVYRSCHMISSKSFTQFPDYPMPEDFPDYPSHRQILQYLRCYAEAFSLKEVIRFSSPVERVEPADGGARWDVTLAGGATRRYAGVVVANGHHRTPKWPDYPGHFSGQTMHSAEYKTPHVLEGRRVLVVGGGNSGCDIAVEAAQNAATVFHSTRRGYYYLPKYVLGVPADRAGDRMHMLRFPLWLRRACTRLLLRATVGDRKAYGLRRPDHELFETHPVVNTLLLYYLRHGDIRPMGDVARLEGDRVRFDDGSVERIDTIVYATGYELDFPFVDRSHLNWRDGKPRLYKQVFHPRYDDLFVAGMIQPDSGIFSLVHWQTKAIALFLAAARDGAPQADWLRKLKRSPEEDLRGGVSYVATERHNLEVEHWSYMQGLKRLVKRLDPDA